MSHSRITSEQDLRIRKAVQVGLNCLALVDPYLKDNVAKRHATIGRQSLADALTEIMTIPVMKPRRRK